MRRFTGEARVFDSEEAALEAILDGKISDVHEAHFGFLPNNFQLPALDGGMQVDLSVTGPEVQGTT
jgi:hypothetical protein